MKNHPSSLRFRGALRLCAAVSVLCQVAAVSIATPTAQAQLPVTNGLVVWLSAEQVNPTDLTQVRIVGSDIFVKQWNDRSGNGHHAVQINQADQPRYIASGAGGKPVLRFAQVNEDAGSELKLGDLSALFPTAASMYAISTVDNDGQYNLFDNQNSDSRWKAAQWNESVPGTFRNNRVAMTFSDFPQTGTHVFSLESSSAAYRFLVDGKTVGGATTGDYYNGSGRDWIIGDRVGGGQQLRGDIPELVLYDRVLTTTEANLVGGYLAQKYAVTSSYPTPPIPVVPTGFGVAGVSAGAIRFGWTAVSSAVSYNLLTRNTLTGVEQVNSVTSTTFAITGLTNGTPYEFQLAAVNASGVSAYSASVSAIPVIATGKQILTFNFPGQPEVSISGTNINLTVPTTTDVAALTPSYTTSLLATGSPLSGVAQDFTSARNYTITAEDGSTQVYIVTVTKGAVPTDFTWNSPTAGFWSDVSKWTNNLASGTKPIASGIDYYTLNFNQPGSYISTHNLNPGFVVNKLNFGGGATLAGTSLALTANGAVLPTINQNAATAVTLNTALNLAANTTFDSTGTGDINLGTLDVPGTGIVTGTGSLTKSGSNLLTINSANTYTGGTIIREGTVSCSLSNPSPLGTGSAVNVTVQNGATLALNRNKFTGTLTLNGGRIGAANGWGDDTWNGSVILGATSAVDVGNTDGCFIINAVISGPGGLIKLGPSNKPMPLTGANTFTGPVSIQAGVLQASSLNRIVGGTSSSSFGAPTTVADGTITLGAGGSNSSLAYSGPGETTDRVIRLAGTTGNATISLQGSGAGLPTTRGESGLMKFTSDFSNPGTAGVDNRKTLILTHITSEQNGTNPGAGEISGSIGDSVLGTAGQLATSVTKAGGGDWTLSGANTYTGKTQVQSGTLIFTRPTALPGGPLDISPGAKVRLNYIGGRQISALTYNGTAAQPNGSYGSSSSLATFKDDTRFAGPGTVIVGPTANASTTVLARTTGSEPSNGGVAVTFTATVTGASPAGNVEFYDGLVLIGTRVLSGTGTATITTDILTSGVHNLTALFTGGPGNAASSATLTQTVVEARTLVTTTSVTSSGSPSAAGASVTFTATVTGDGPTGSVIFYNGGVPLGTSVTNASGQASFTASGLAVGWRSITAQYLGSASHLPSRTAKAFFQTVNPGRGNGKLKVFILAGQSNMVGKGQTELGRDPNNLGNTNLVGGFGSLRNMVNREPDKYGCLVNPAVLTPQGNPSWVKRSDVWVTYTGDATEPGRTGMLDTDFGGTGGQGLIGPEYGFGLIAGNQFEDPVLLIKTAWGGRSLAVDFRPPGAVAARGGNVGPFYTNIVNRVNQVLGNIAAYYPAYTGNGYELSGFAWHQGFNDRITASFTAEYEANMTNLIKDLRAEFRVPTLPVVIGDTGMFNAPTGPGSLLEAQANVANPARHPEFTGNVVTVQTNRFDYGITLGTSTEGYHWNWSGESYFNIGDSMGTALMALIPLTTPGFAAWASDPAQGLTAGVNSGPLDDPDRDGVSNLMEFVLTGSPQISSQAGLPTLKKSTSDWVFEYNRSDLSLSAATNQVVEYGSDLIGWTAVPILENGGGTVTITPGTPADRVQVTIPNQGQRAFVRLKVAP